MKRIIFSIIGSMLISLCALQAQERDTTGMASKSRDKQNKQRYEQSQQQRDQTRRQQDQTRQQRDQARQTQDDKSRNAYANEGMVIIDKDEIPASLKRTLQKEKYAGWENATVYHNTNTGEYVIAPRAYRFDEQGKEIPMGDAAYGSRDGQSRYGQDQRQGQNMQQQPGERTSQSQQGQDRRDETSTYSSEDQSQNNAQYQGNESSQTKRNQTSKTQPQSYDQATRNQQQTDDESTTDDKSSATQQRSYDQSSQDQQERADQSSQSQDESSSAYRRDQSQQSQREGQEPSTSYRSGQDDQSSRSGQEQSGQPGGTQYRTEDMTELQPGEIPATLRRTLSESKYSGWEENGTLYRDPSTNEYVLVMEKSDQSSQPRAYRFDKNGQLKEGQNETGDQSGTGENESSRRNNGQ